MTRRVLVFVYGLVVYVLFLLTFLYAIGFVTNLYVPRSMDAPPGGSFASSLAIDLGLLMLFALQHSVMARYGFKRRITRLIPEPAERSTYVLASSLALALLFAFWRPLGGVIWSIQQPVAAAIVDALAVFGWLLVLFATCLINHFDLFGLRQAWLYLRGEPYSRLTFQTPGPYKLVRHPLYVGWFFAFWSTPIMTLTHLLYAVTTTCYIIIAIQFEEQDLIVNHGDDYRDYRQRVPMLIPGVRPAESLPSPLERRPSR
jgi:methanethiol S-methyltransferase